METGVVSLLVGMLLCGSGGVEAAKSSEDAGFAEAVPDGGPPGVIPAPPPAAPPGPPGAPTPSGEKQVAAGQWIYTSQFGWVWMPYGDEYVFTPEDDAASPFVYVYEPAVGWTWLLAPWIWGIGPVPYFGPLGAWRYHWYRGPPYYPHSPSRPVFRGGWRGPPPGGFRAGHPPHH